ncbi:hypothetical protein PITCH_A1500014 [uncultured Desulfobacterium sp.]|uniref:Flagellar assembly protein FliH n=1 Tax=uncultured Desulfobacterium sp. TaxID=201089 RepID=A0A445MTA1_9BACT|nr:hypothetical protein PITCH_A1500014 [uncultured Desulfobacterium sp.]
MRPYCFPNVNFDKPDGVESHQKKQFFKPIGFDEKGNLCTNTKERAGHPDETLSNKDKKLRQIEENAYNIGFIKGEKDGLNSLRGRLESLLRSLDECIGDVERLKKKILIRAEREAVELSIAIAKKIVCHEISVNSGVILNVVKEALNKLSNYKKMRILLAPSDIKLLQDALKNNPEFGEYNKALLFVEDRNIMPGGCIIETDIGDIDARIDKQLQIVEDIFKSELDKL